MTLETLSILPLGFALGLVHALDADHVMAVSSLTTGRPEQGRAWRTSLLWSLGHSALLLLVACMVIPLGLVIPAGFSRAAEALVGVGMIGLGLWVFRGMLRRRGHIHFHLHDGMPSHAHWHLHAAAPTHGHHRKRSGHAHIHAPVMLGALHGLAGSAPIFALLPALGQGSFALAISYIALFSAGLMLAMLLFGGLLGQLMTRLFERFGSRGIRGLQSLAASGSMLVGALLVGQSL
ncbi:MAG: urease accessory protein [Deltaproteobacteria bacterium]|nr:urease accessory protein [Deltaproteobacteria bacterium]